MKYSAERGSASLRFLDKYFGIPIIIGLSLFTKKNKVIPVSIQKVAFLKTSAIGDTILLSAVVRDLRERYQDVHLTFFTGGSNHEAARLLSGIDRIIKLPMKNPLKAIRVVKDAGEFDVWIDFDSWPRLNAILTFFADADFQIGFKTKGQFKHYIYDLAVEHSDKIHELYNYKNLLKPLNINGINLPFIEGKIDIDSKDKIIVIHMFPGGSRSYLKEWPEKNWIELINILTDLDYKIYLTGSKADRARALKITEDVKNKDLIYVAAGERDLQETARLLKSSKLVISVDTGIMHMSSALGCNLISLHGPTSPQRWGPLNKNYFSIQSSLQCSPCLNLGFENICNENICMKAIKLEDVLKKIHEVLKIHKRDCLVKETQPVF